MNRSGRVDSNLGISYFTLLLSRRLNIFDAGQSARSANRSGWAKLARQWILRRLIDRGGIRSLAKLGVGLCELAGIDPLADMCAEGGANKRTPGQIIPGGNPLNVGEEETSDLD